jgi:hypothetical protein
MQRASRRHIDFAEPRVRCSKAREAAMESWSFLRRTANVVGELMAIGALAVIARFAALLWSAYHGHPVFKG